MVHISKPINDPHLEPLQKLWFQKICVNTIFGKGPKNFVAFWCFGSKISIQKKKDGSHPLFQFIVVVVIGGC